MMSDDLRLVEKAVKTERLPNWQTTKVAAMAVAASAIGSCSDEDTQVEVDVGWARVSCSAAAE